MVRERKRYGPGVVDLRNAKLEVTCEYFRPARITEVASRCGPSDTTNYHVILQHGMNKFPQNLTSIFAFSKMVMQFLSWK
jgi:hypothetical protein